MFYAYIHGILLTFGLIIPLGIQNIFVFNQGASQRYLTDTLPTIITASLCDAVLIICAVSGVSMIVLNILWLKKALFLLGGIFLIYMGFASWYKQKSTTIYAGQKPLSAKRQIMFSLSVSILNPHALLDTIAVIGTNSMQFNGYFKYAFTLGCISTSCLWFLSLAILGRFLNTLDNSGQWQIKLNQFSAIILWLIGVYLFWQLLILI